MPRGRPKKKTIEEPKKELKEEKKEVILPNSSSKAQTKEEKLGEEIGKISHYFTKIGVGVIEITKGSLKVGDNIKIKGATTDFEQKIDSMQIEHEKVQEAKAGQSIGLKVKEHVREHDMVYKV